ncbi:MAG TPA: glycosyltransferase family 2 protein [Pyrinomonadaceae bacterium]|nr:glycosyltransferase family 2 protein [Pyrinomonadaceae bacterium]
MLFQFLDEVYCVINEPQTISAIIATVGRPELLKLCLESLSKQTVRIAEVVIVHCGDDADTMALAHEERWREAGMDVRYFHHPERNCAQQRNFAIERAKYENLLLIDDDIEVDSHWVEELFQPIWTDPSVGATMGNLINQPLATPTLFWRMYRIIMHGRVKGFEPGRLVGAALPNGFPTTAEKPIRCEWIGGGASALRRRAFESVGGFASFFAGSSPGEDLDLGYRLSRKWKVYYVPSAKCIHHQALSGREKSDQHQYLSMRSRFGILTITMGKSRYAALAQIGFWALVQFLSELASLRHGVLRPDLPRAWAGRLRGFLSCVHWSPERTRPAAS